MDPLTSLSEGADPITRRTMVTGVRTGGMRGWCVQSLMPCCRCLTRALWEVAALTRVIIIIFASATCRLPWVSGGRARSVIQPLFVVTQVFMLNHSSPFRFSRGKLWLSSLSTCWPFASSALNARWLLTTPSLAALEMLCKLGWFMVFPFTGNSVEHFNGFASEFVRDWQGRNTREGDM